MNIPNSLTLARAALIPFIVLFFYLPFKWASLTAGILFVIACITDWLDGYLARKLGERTDLGAFLDPIADKILVAVVLIMLVDLYQVFYITIAAMIIIAREIIISALREWMAEIGKQTSVAVSNIGKFKTGLQMASLALLLGNDPYTFWAYVGCVTLIAAVILTIWSVVVYIKQAKKDFGQSINS